LSTGQGQILSTGKSLLSSPKHPDWFWGLPSLILNGYHVLSWA